MDAVRVIINRREAMGDCRVSQLKAMVRAIDGLSSTQRYAVLGKIGTHTLDAIEAAAASGWMPVSLNVLMADAVYEVAGAQATRDWSRRLSLESFETGMMRQLAKGMQALLEFSPKTWFKRVPTGWAAVYRGCGEMKAEIDPVEERAVLRLLRTPVEMRSPGFVTSMAGGFEALLTLTKAKGQVTSVLRGDTIELVITWERRK